MGAKEACFEVLLTVDEVDDFIVVWILKQPVDGEITSRSIVLWGGEGNTVRVSAIFVGAVMPKGSNLKGEAVFVHQDDPKVSTDGIGVGEKLLNLVGGGRGGDIIVLRLCAEQHISHASTGEVGCMTSVG